MSWIVAGLIAGVLAYLADYVMWGKVFTRGMESYGTMERAEREMTGMLAKSAGLTIAWGLFFAFLYDHFRSYLWVPPGPLAGMELATTLWASTILFATVGSGVWYDKARRLLTAQLWSWLVRMNAAGIAVGLLLQ
jgi:hypothetical protein